MAPLAGSSTSVGGGVVPTRREKRTPPRPLPLALHLSLESAPTQVPCRCAFCKNEHVRVHIPVLFTAVLSRTCKPLAEAVGLYNVLWAPPLTAGQLVAPLSAGLATLLTNPADWRNFDAPASWGLYDFFVPWVTTYLAACEAYPTSYVRVTESGSVSDSTIRRKSHT